MELRSQEPSEIDFGPEHNALVADADQLLSVGKADEAAGVVLRLRMRYPDSPHTRRVHERLKIAGGANEYWRKNDRGNDFHTTFWRAWGGASWSGIGVLLWGIALLFTLAGFQGLLMGAPINGALELLIACVLWRLGLNSLRRSRA
jgi:hypothetical protein